MWKNLAGWLKGGIISSGIGLFLIFCDQTLPQLTIMWNKARSLPYFDNPDTTGIFILLTFAETLFYFFCIGALIGLIISKIKSKK